jgi:hypothetical protein
MKTIGTQPDEIEIGNAWESRSPNIPQTNWIVGTFPTIPDTSLRYMRQSNDAQKIAGQTAKDVSMKWFAHSTKDPLEWGNSKPSSKGRTMSILVDSGEMKLSFIKEGQEFSVTLDTPGDFAVWGPGLDHSWEPIRNSTVLTLRWIPD